MTYHHYPARRMPPTHRFLPGLGFVGTGFVPTFAPLPDPNAGAPQSFASFPAGAPAASKYASLSIAAHLSPGAAAAPCIPGAVCNTGDPYTSGIVSCDGGVPRCVPQPRFTPPLVPGGPGAGSTMQSAATPPNGDGSKAISDAQQIAPDVMGTSAQDMADAQAQLAQAQATVNAWSQERKMFAGTAVATSLAALLAWKFGFKKTAAGLSVATAGAVWAAWKQPVFWSK